MAAAAITVLKVFEYLLKGADVGKAVYTICQTCVDDKLSTEKKASRIALNVIYSAGVFAEGYTHFVNSPLKYQVATKVLATGSNVAKSYEEGAGGRQLGLIMAYGAADVAGVCCPNHEGILQLAEIGLKCEKDFMIIENTWNLFIWMKRLIRGKISQTEQPTTTQPPIALEGQQAQEFQQFVTMIHHNNQINQSLAAIRNAHSINDLHEIPTLFQPDEILQLHICPITHLPIRHVLVVTSTEHDESPVYYERDAIQQRIQNPPANGELPPSWPNGIPLQNVSLSVPLPVRAIINRRLQKLLEDGQKNLPDHV